MKQEKQEMIEPDDNQNDSRKSGFRFLVGMVAFFVIVASVDAFFVFKALSTHSGVVSENAYEIGLRYNDIIAEAKKRKDEAAKKTEIVQ